MWQNFGKLRQRRFTIKPSPQVKTMRVNVYVMLRRGQHGISVAITKESETNFDGVIMSWRVGAARVAYVNPLISIGFGLTIDDDLQTAANFM